MRLLSVLVGFLLPLTAAAQNEWSNFPSAPPPSRPVVDAGTPASVPIARPAPAPAPVLAPAPAPARNATPDIIPAPSRDNFDPTAKARTEERLRAAERGEPIPNNSPAVTTTGKPAPDADKLPIVSKKEEFLPGTEPHSDGTWNNDFTDPANARVTVGSVGIGVLHVSSARLGPKGVLRFSVLGEYLNINDFPVLGTSNVRSAGTFAASWQILSWLEVYGGYGATANSNDRTSPRLIQALGDLNFGAKVSREWVKGLWAGVDARGLTFSAIGNQSVDRWAVGFKPAIIAAYDFRTITPKLPAIFHLNLGFTIDNSSGLFNLNTTGTQPTPNASEEFALSLNRFNRFNLGLALEVPLPWVMPYVEYQLGLPLGVPGGQLDGPNAAKVDITAAMPQTLGVGLKVTAIKDLTLLVGVDIGLIRSVGLGVPATPPWNFLVGASFNIDPFQRGETKIVETIRERTLEKKVAAAAKTGKVEGTVLDAETKKPIPGVIVAMVGAGLPPVASDAPSGKFVTHELPAGAVKLHASRDGYKELDQEVKLESGKTAKVEILMQSEVKKGVFDLTVTSKKKPINSTVVFVGGPTPQTAGTSEANPAPVKVEAPAGTYTVNVTAPGYLAQTREVQIPAGGVMALGFDLAAAPKKLLVVFKQDKIEILQQVHFEFGKATILGDSFSLLDQVVDAIIANNVKRIKVEGHTDNKGGKEKNQKLSEDRARSVADYLISRGIDKSRLESVGYGDTRPVAPNLTAKGRELNRRVEFIVVER